MIKWGEEQVKQVTFMKGIGCCTSCTISSHWILKTALWDRSRFYPYFSLKKWRQRDAWSHLTGSGRTELWSFSSSCYKLLVISLCSFLQGPLVLARKWWPCFIAEEVEEAEIKWPAKLNPNSTVKSWESHGAPADVSPERCGIYPVASIFSLHGELAPYWVREHINHKTDFPKDL